MFNSGILDVAIGLIVVFILVSTVCTAVREAIESRLKTRAAYCHYAICELLDDVKGASGIARQFFKHPLISSLYRKDGNETFVPEKPSLFSNGGNMPSYVPARSFATVLIDIVARSSRSQPGLAAPVTSASLRARAAAFDQSEHIRAAILSALDASGGDLRLARQQLENWFDTTMDRVSGWYKRSTQTIIFVIAVVVTGVLNVDAIAIAETLYRDQATRAAIVAMAEQIKPEQLEGAQAMQRLNTLHLPIGWSAATNGADDIFKKLLGLLLTAFGATLGAPFWFDVLNRVMVIRATVKPHEKSPEEPSQDGPVGGRTSARSTPIVQVVTREVVSNAGSLRSTAPGNDVDACALGDDDPTPDEALPAATGGVST